MPSTPTDASAPAPMDDPASPSIDVQFHFDPICPFAWITSRWLLKVADRFGYRIEWRFLSLLMLNTTGDAATPLPKAQFERQSAGLAMLRVAAAVSEVAGSEGIGRLYTAIGESIFGSVDPADTPPATLVDAMGSREHLIAVLTAAGLPTDLAAAADDSTHDRIIADQTEAALGRTGRDVGTPIIIIGGPDGPALFGPVVSRIPDDDDDAERLWAAVVDLAAFEGFAELRRSPREAPQLPAPSP